MALRLVLLMSSGSKKKEPAQIRMSAKLHIHKECGQRFHPLLHTSYTMDCHCPKANWQAFFVSYIFDA
jgi:hypothetical protein